MSDSGKTGKEPDPKAKRHVTEREARQASDLEESTKEFRQAARTRLPRKPSRVRKGE